MFTVKIKMVMNQPYEFRFKGYGMKIRGFVAYEKQINASKALFLIKNN